MSYSEFREHVRKNPIPLSSIEERAVEFAKQQAAQFVVGLGNKINTQTGQLMIEADSRLRNETREGIRDRVSTNIAERKSLKQLKSDLGWMAKDWTRDWDRISVTEKHTAMQRGVADHYADRYGTDERVAKRPLPSACKHCKRLHLGPDGQPRIFKLSTLEGNGLNNFGRKSADWLAVVGSTHPFCGCSLVRVPSGWGFNEEGQMVPGGELGEFYEDESDLARSMLREMDLQKSFALQGHMTFQGIPIAIENKVGTVRRWSTDDGQGGETKMLHAYGYVKRTLGDDNDEVDVYVGPAPDAPMAFLCHQQSSQTGIYDETKVFLGFLSEAQAVAAYKAHMDDSEALITTTPMLIDQFKRWAGSTQPATGEMFKSDRPVQKMAIPLDTARIRTPSRQVTHTLRKSPELQSSGQVAAYIGAADSPAGRRGPGTGVGMANMYAGLEHRPPDGFGLELRQWVDDQIAESAHARESIKRDVEKDYNVQEPSKRSFRYAFVIPDTWGTLDSEVVAERRDSVERMDPHGWRNTGGASNSVEVGSDERVK